MPKKVLCNRLLKAVMKQKKNCRPVFPETDEISKPTTRYNFWQSLHPEMNQKIISGKGPKSRNLS